MITGIALIVLGGALYTGGALAFRLPVMGAGMALAFIGAVLLASRLVGPLP